MPSKLLCESILCLAMITAGGCAHRRSPVPLAWRYDVVSVPDRVVPPAELAPVNGIYRVPIVDLAYARPECHVEAGEFALLQTGARLTLQFPQTVFQNEGHDPAEAWDVFRDAALRLEDNTCLPSNAVHSLSRQLLAAVALTTRTGYGIRYGSYERTGAINLEPGFRLKVVAPLLQPGVKEVKIVQAPNAKGGPLEFTAEGLDGYETSYYAVQPREGGGVQFALSSVEQNRMNVITHPGEPTGFQFHLPPDARYFHLMFLRRASAADRDISLLGAPEWGLMLDSAQRFDTIAGAVNDCEKVPGLACIALSKQTAILSEIGIEANGQMVYLPVGGTLDDLLGTTVPRGRKVEVPPGLKVERVWHGRMIPFRLDLSNPRSLDLALMAGDNVSW